MFVIPPTADSPFDMVNEAATLAKEAGVKHALLLTASSCDLDPKHKWAVMNGNMYHTYKKVRKKSAKKCNLSS